MAQIIVTTIGSWGDVLPLIPVARGLLERGHTVTVVIDSIFAGLVDGEAIPFAAFDAGVGADREEIAAAVFEPGRPVAERFSALIEGLVLPQIPAAYDALTAACSGADLLLTHPYQLAGPMAAAATGVPSATLSLFPGAVASRFSRPPGDLLKPGPEEDNLAAWEEFRKLLRRFDAPLNVYRVERGLPEVENGFLDSGLAPGPILVLASEAYTPRQPDWPRSIQVTGFTTWDKPTGWRLPPVLDSFLDSDDAPIAFTLGTTVRVDPDGFYEAAVAALDLCGRRGLFVLGRIADRGGWSEVIASERRAVVSYAPLTELLPRCAAVVHHGGFSTTAAALTAGCPAVITPRGVDQPFHAQRVQALGAGVALPWEHLDAGSLRAAIDEVTRDPSYGSAAAGLAARIRAENGPGRTCDEIEAMLMRMGRG